MSDPVPQHAGVRLIPPLVFLAGLVIGYVADLIWHVPIAPPDWSLPVRITGGILLAVGLWLPLSASRLFAIAGTPVPPWRPSTQLVLTGPYRYTRNPMYLGLSLFVAGAALLGNALWPLVALVPVLVIIRTQVIAREERYLEARFGDAYRDFKSRVRRWL